MIRNRARGVVASTATARVDAGTRIYRLSTLCYGIGGTVFALLAIGDELSQADYFLPWFTTVSLVLLPLPAIVAALSLWAPRQAIRAVLLTSVALFGILLPLSLVTETVPFLPGGRSLWLLDIISVITTAAALSCTPRSTWLIVGTLCVGGGVIRLVQSDFGLLAVSVQDTLNMLLVSSLFAALALVTVKLSGELDLTLTNTLREATQAAETEARRIEQQRIDGMIHDDILATLLSASKGVGALEVARSARTALQSIRNESDRTRGGELLDASALGILLRARVTGIAEGIDFEFDADESVVVGEDVAGALAEATAEALRNSLKHAGEQAGLADSTVTRSVLVVANRSGIMVRIADDGRGFTLNGPSRRGLGIQTSIIMRMQNVGGSAAILSQLGEGTVVVLTWPER